MTSVNGMTTKNTKLASCVNISFGNLAILSNEYKKTTRFDIFVNHMRFVNIRNQIE